MKRLIVAAILFVVVIATYLTSLFYITDSCDKAKSMVENSISVYTKNQTAKKEARNLENYWNKKEPLLSVFVNHDRIDDIETAISLMNVYAKIPKNERDTIPVISDGENVLFVYGFGADEKTLYRAGEEILEIEIERI